MTDERDGVHWQVYYCPETGVDVDLQDGEMVYEGEEFPCLECGETHIATPDLVKQHAWDDMGPRTVPLQKRGEG